MGMLRDLWSVLRGTSDRDAFASYRRRVLQWAAENHDLRPAEIKANYEGRYLDIAGRDLFLDYLVSAAKEAPSYVTDHEGLLADRRKLFERFAHPILTMREVVAKENERLERMDSPYRM